MTDNEIKNDEGPKTFANVIETISDRKDLASSRRRDLISSLRRMAKYFDLPTTEVPANTRWLRQRLRQLHPKQVGVTEKSLATVKSAVLAALKLAGSNNGLTEWQPKMNASYKALYDAVPDRLMSYKLSRFFRWCSSQNLEPNQLAESHIEAFEAHLIETSFQKDPGKAVRGAVLTWNKMRELVDGWPDVTLFRAPARVPWTYALDTFPASFQSEVDAWCKRMAMTDLFDNDAPVRASRPATVQHRRFQIRMMASAIVHAGVPIGEITALSNLVDMKNFRLGIQFMIDRQDGKITESLFTLVTGIKSIARYFVKVDEDNLEQLKRLCSKIDKKADRYRKKNKDRLAQFDDDQNFARLLALPERLLEKAKSPGPKPRSSALLFQSAVAIEILLLSLLRISNLAGLDIDRNLRWIQEGRQLRLLITIPSEQVKNDKPLYFELSGRSAQMVRTYIDDVRPGLSEAPGTALFPRMDGGPKNPGDLSSQIKRHIFAETGLTVNAHLFRSLGGKIHNRVHAGDAATMAHVLGDRMETVMKSYLQFEQKASLDTYQSSVNSFREKKAA